MLLRLFAPFLPFVTEEVWSWWQPGSIHRAPWPSAERARDGRRPTRGSGPVLEVASDVLSAIRGAKTEARRSMRAPVASLEVTDTAERIAALVTVEGDVVDAGGVLSMATAVGDDPSVEVVLLDEE